MNTSDSFHNDPVKVILWCCKEMGKMKSSRKALYMKKTKINQFIRKFLQEGTVSTEVLNRHSNMQTSIPNA